MVMKTAGKNVNMPIKILISHPLLRTDKNKYSKTEHSRKLAFKIIDTCKIFIYCLLFQVVDCVNCLSPLSAYQAYGYLAVYWVPGGPVRALSTQQQATSVTVSLWTAAARPAWPVSQTCSLVCSPSPFGWPRRKLNFQRIALNLNSRSLSQFIYFIISPSICALIFPKLHK